MVKVNGEELALEGAVLENWLREAGYDLRRVAVERNGEIVPRKSYGETVLAPGDTVEVVSFVGGG